MNSRLKLGMQPFWFWNGDMKKEEIVRQIQEMKQKGIPGFMIHPRQGMELPYLSEEYFDRVRLAVQTAKESDMEVWIYDEYPYPSGICGGEVVLDHPEFLCKRLKKAVCEAKGGEAVRLFAPWGRVLLARAYRVRNGRYCLDDYIDLEAYVGTGYQQEVFQYSGLTKYNKKRYFTGAPGKLLTWTPPDGEWKIYLVTEAVLDHFKYFNNFIDTLNPEAIRYFLELTHERYKKYVGEEFGKTIKGFFTDEVTAFPDKEPWSPLLPGKVMERYGIDLISSLPALWEDLGEVSSKVRYAYWNTATDCFIESYDKTVYEWCENNHLLYIGEKPIMRSKELKYVHIPGIDAGHQKVGSPAKMVSERYRSNGKMISSAAHFYDKPAALCEAGHSIGWGMTMQDLKWIFDWLAVQGVDFYVIHGFFYTTDGLKKHDAPPSAFFQMAWWEDAACLTKYASDLGRFLQSLKRQVQILVLDPVTSSWTSGQAEQALLKEDFAKLQNRMLCEELDYYIIDPELFAQGEVAERNGAVTFRIHGEDYEVLVLPPMRNLEAGACRKVVEFASKGGKVCALSCIPFEKIEDCDAVKEMEALFGLDGQTLWDAYINQLPRESRENGTVCYAAEREELIGRLKHFHLCPWQVIPLDGRGRDGLPGIFGIDGEGRDTLFLVNTTPDERCVEIRDRDGKTEKLVLEAYESRIIRAGLAGLERSAERLCVEGQCTEKQCTKSQCTDLHGDVITLSLEDTMEFTTGSSNILRLSDWTMTLPDGQEAKAEPAPIIDQLEAGGFLRPVRQKKYFGCPKELDFEGTSVTYRTEFECRNLIDKNPDHGNQNRFYLVMEPGTFLGKWQILINGCMFREQDFVQNRVYLDSNLTADISEVLKEGKNLVEVTVNTEVSYGGMRNPLYLSGDFRVSGADHVWTLLPPLREGRMENLTELGLPFYCGEITFSTQIRGDFDGSRTVSIRLLAPWLTDSIRLRIGEFETEPCAWRPYFFEIPGELLKRENGRVEIVVRNTAIGLFEGQCFCQDSHSYETIEPE